MMELEDRENRLRVLIWTPEHGPPPKGVTIFRLLDQDVWWQPKAGEPIRIVDMEDRHRANLIAWLEGRASSLKFGYETWLLSGPQPSGDAACDAFDLVASEIMEMPVDQWLSEFPLVKALRS